VTRINDEYSCSLSSTLGIIKILVIFIYFFKEILFKLTRIIVHFEKTLQISKTINFTH
jgi:hypothetical protein